MDKLKDRKSLLWQYILIALLAFVLTLMNKHEYNYIYFNFVFIVLYDIVSINHYLFIFEKFKKDSKSKNIPIFRKIAKFMVVLLKVVWDLAIFACGFAGFYFLIVYRLKDAITSLEIMDLFIEIVAIVLIITLIDHQKTYTRVQKPNYYKNDPLSNSPPYNPPPPPKNPKPPPPPPKPKVELNESEFLKALQDQVIGQNFAKIEVLKALKKNILKEKALKTPSPILGTFFFVGPTGVGKTETSKAIAKYFEKFGYQYLRFDMGGFSDYHTASTLVGSPRGYIGSEEGGALTRPLMKNPRAVILFDEMEKAHPSLFKTFMSLIDEGEIQEVSTGARVKLDQAIVIFTSNLYQELIGKLFEVIQDEIERDNTIRDVMTGDLSKASYYVSHELIEKAKKQFHGDGTDRALTTTGFPPEFVGRIDKVVPFSSLTYQDYVAIVNKLAKKYNKKVVPGKIVDKYISIAKHYGVRQFIKKVEEEILLGDGY